LSSSNLSTIISSTGELEKPDDNQPILEEQKHRPLVKTAISRWVATPIAYLFPKAHREEWLGDLYESHQEMIEEEYPHWLINIVDILRVFVLIGSALKINLIDLISKSGRK
jgi:hypothetical protein